MKQSRTHRRKHQSKRKHSSHRRRTHRRRTHRRGGVSNPCISLDNRFNLLKNRAEDMTINNYEVVVNDFRALQDEARRSNCFDLAREIDRYENTILYSKIELLHRQA